MRNISKISICGFVATLAVALAGGPGLAGARNHSGTLVIVDPAAGTVVLGEVGPWRVQRGTTEITRRTIALTPGTEITRVRRVKEPGAGGWPGAFGESPISVRDLKPGDFVTVTVAPDGSRLTASKITVVEPGAP